MCLFEGKIAADGFPASVGRLGLDDNLFSLTLITVKFTQSLVEFKGLSRIVPWFQLHKLLSRVFE